MTENTTISPGREQLLRQRAVGRAWIQRIHAGVDQPVERHGERARASHRQGDPDQLVEAGPAMVRARRQHHPQIGERQREDRMLELDGVQENAQLAAALQTQLCSVCASACINHLALPLRTCHMAFAHDNPQRIIRPVTAAPPAGRFSAQYCSGCCCMRARALHWRPEGTWPAICSAGVCEIVS